MNPPTSDSSCQSRSWVLRHCSGLPLGKQPRRPGPGLKLQNTRGRPVRVCAGRFANPYKLLDLKPDADLRQIKRAYRKKALQHHPDINDSPDAEEMFIAVQEAYQVLTGRSKPSEDPQAAGGESWDFHDWYWDFLMGRRHNRKWDSSGRQGPPPFVAQPSTRHQVQEQLGGLRRKAAARQAKLQRQSPGVCRQGQPAEPAEDSAVAYAAQTQATAASMGTSRPGHAEPARQAVPTGNATFTHRFVAKTQKALAHTQRQSRQALLVHTECLLSRMDDLLDLTQAALGRRHAPYNPDDSLQFSPAARQQPLAEHHSKHLDHLAWAGQVPTSKRPTHQQLKTNWHSASAVMIDLAVPLSSVPSVHPPQQVVYHSDEPCASCDTSDTQPTNSQPTEHDDASHHASSGFSTSAGHVQHQLAGLRRRAARKP